MRGGGGGGFFLHFLLSFLLCFETNFIYYIPGKPRSFQKSHNVWDCALCDIILWLLGVD